MECLNKMVSKSKMRQGEAFPLRFQIFTKELKNPPTPSYAVVGQLSTVVPAPLELLAAKVAITVGTLRKTWEKDGTTVIGDITFDPNTGLWHFPITQAESLAMAPGEYPGTIKVRFQSGDTLLSEIDPLLMIESIDKEVL